MMSVENVGRMLTACSEGDVNVVQHLLSENEGYASEQESENGRSPLMMAAGAGNLPLVQFLLDSGAPWNALDRMGQCAGDYATNAEHWDTVNLLVDWATKAELILGATMRNIGHNSINPANQANLPLEQQSSTKPDYLQQPLRYNDNGTALLDEQNDAVMMQWEQPLMKLHAQILMGVDETTGIVPRPARKRVINVGFGMGIVDTAIQEFNPALHIIIEAHPDVHKMMIEKGWHQKPGVQICFGKWQDVLPQLIRQGVVVDAIFFDTYGEHFTDMEDFHSQMIHILAKPYGIYSFFNGLAPDNMFFHGVACNCVKMQLSQLGFNSEFLPCEFQIDPKVWEGVRRKYWHGRDTYYLPRVTWDPELLRTMEANTPMQEEERKNKATTDSVEVEGELKRQRK